MTKRGLIPASLARELGISHVAVKNYLEGRIPDSRRLPQLAQYFDVSMEYLLSGEVVSEPEDASTVKNRKLSEMNFELRTPLNGVLGFADLLSTTTLSKEQRQQVEMIRNSGNALLGKLNKLAAIAGETAAAQTPEAPANQAPSTVAGRRVLVVEDDPSTRKLFLTMLSTLGVTADQAANGTAALDMHAAAPYDIIFMDVRLPQVSGLETTRLIREREEGSSVSSPVHIIATTAQVMAGDRERCFESGMNDFLSKPIVRADIVRALQNVPSK
jgi:CheY-like chemotaxis protein